MVARLYPVTETLFAPFNLIYIAVIGAVGLAAVLALHPRSGARTLTPEQIDAILPQPPPREDPVPTPAGASTPSAAGSGWPRCCCSIRSVTRS